MFLGFCLLLPMATAVYRENVKTLKTLPSFSHSLVNLGKMDLSFYLMAKPEDFKKFDHSDHSSTFISPRVESIVEEPCPCTAGHSSNMYGNHPSDIIKRLLTNNDLFSYHNQPETSIMCCNSHENVQEETILFEFSPKLNSVKENLEAVRNPLPFLPFTFDTAHTNNPTAFKPNAVEIFFFPKKKDVNQDSAKVQKKEINKPDIQIVGDKEIRNDFKTMKLLPPYLGQSVKKDLAIKDKDKTLTTTDDGIKLDTTVPAPNML